MARILKASSSRPHDQRTSDQRISDRRPHYVDLSGEIAAELETSRQQASQLLDKARLEADSIRMEAAEAGAADAERVFHRRLEEAVDARYETLAPALQHAVAGIQREKTRQLRQYERGVIQLATSIAQRVIRRELSQSPEITLDLIREALDLAVGSERIKLHLHPSDYEALGKRVVLLTKRLSDTVTTEIVSDPEVERGGCIVKTEFGLIDQQFQTQLARVEEELI